MKQMFSFLNFILFWSILEGHYRLYHSHYPVLNNDHDYFYRYESNHNDLARHLVPYCIRYNPINLNGECLGTSFTFNQLRSNNITLEKLWEWFAPVDLIDKYGVYLLTEITNYQSEQIYCNCSDSLSFGTYCQYRFMLADETSSFDEIVNESLLETKYDENDLYLMDENNSLAHH